MRGETWVDADIDELCLSFLVRQAWLNMRGAMDGALSGLGLSVAQYASLLVLADQPGITIADLARAVASTRQSANELLAGLADQGLVERRRHPTDGRSQQVFLTDAGRERLDEARPVVRERERELEAGFSDEERRLARQWLRRMTGDRAE
ncbi:MarR family transcriptional regulator [Streptomyces sp. NPDC026673]|uniref:MarR family winged helix-turn-helix transcriptional regulator n=1 Tax=Streptomyces sp. NPDC026673 TaxID=3155724 RepID=UPI0034010219